MAAVDVARARKSFLTGDLRGGEEERRRDARDEMAGVRRVCHVIASRLNASGETRR